VTGNQGKRRPLCLQGRKKVGDVIAHGKERRHAGLASQRGRKGVLEGFISPMKPSGRGEKMFCFMPVVVEDTSHPASRRRQAMYIQRGSQNLSLLQGEKRGRSLTSRSARKGKPLARRGKKGRRFNGAIRERIILCVREKACTKKGRLRKKKIVPSHAVEQRREKKEPKFGRTSGGKKVIVFFST